MKCLAIWASLALFLNFLWKSHSFHSIPSGTIPTARVAAYVLHCLLGDVLIAVSVYLLTAIVFHDLAWPVRRPWTAGGFMLAAGLGFTVFSEWYNVYVTGAWAYQPAMPLVASIGLTPLLQWVVVPTLMLFIARHLPAFRTAAR